MWKLTGMLDKLQYSCPDGTGAKGERNYEVSSLSKFHNNRKYHTESQGGHLVEGERSTHGHLK